MKKLAPIAEKDPSGIALVDERGETTWRELDQRANRLLAALRGRGLEGGDIVAVLSGNRREYFELLAATAHGGLVLVPINWHLAAPEVAYLLDDSGAKALLVDPRFADLAQAALAESTVQPDVLALFGEGDAAPFESYETLLGGGSEAEPDDQTQGMVMFYTSGTTGRPKGVKRTVDLGKPVDPNPMRTQGFCMMLGMPPDGVTLLCGPVYHSAQYAFSYLLLEAGSTVVMRHKFDAAETLGLIDRHQVTNVHLVPTQFVRLLRLADDQRAAFDGSSLQRVLHGAAPCPPEVKRRMIDWWGPIVSEYYGGTEGAVISVIDSEQWLERPTSVGRPLPMVEVRVLDPDGKPCAAGESGRIFIRSQMVQEFEYHEDAEKTASVHREPGLFTMGDVGFLDDDGFLHLSDREIDMIISGGVNIYPAEVEQALGDHPAVQDVAVFGVPDEEFGEQVKAVVVPAAGSASPEDLAADLISYCREKLAHFKAPKSIDFTDALPRHETGKLYKRLLRDRYWPAR